MARLLLFDDNSDGYYAVVFLIIINGYLILHIHFIFIVIKVGLVFIGLCRVKILCA
jgi:hypothetical protein